MKNVIFAQQTEARANLEVVSLIGRKKKLHNISEELIKPAAVKIMEITCGTNYSKQINSVSLCAKIIKRRISNLARRITKNK